MNHAIRRFLHDEHGQDLVEYAFLIVFIALLITATLTASEASIASVFSRIVASLDGGS